MIFTPQSRIDERSEVIVLSNRLRLNVDGLRWQSAFRETPQDTILSLESLLGLNRNNKAIEIKDRVYALMGIASDINVSNGVVRKSPVIVIQR